MASASSVEPFGCIHDDSASRTKHFLLLGCSAGLDPWNHLNGDVGVEAGGPGLGGQRFSVRLDGVLKF